jgi:hypothetical protein
VIHIKKIRRRLTNYKFRAGKLSQTEGIESLAIMENLPELSPKTNHKDNFSVLQYYFKEKSQKLKKGWSYILLLSKILNLPLPTPVE